MPLIHTLKQKIPPSWLQPYHFVLALAAAVVYGNPSRKLTVIGVTGTKGKSSTVQMIAQLLTALGEKVGYTSTAGFAIDGRVIENRMKMTMPGRFFLQRMLADMVKAQCRYAVIETSSQGIVQYRHVGIHYNVVVFTNLTPEHIESHGGFAAYRAAKAKLFLRRPDVIVTNADDEHGAFFGALPAGRHVEYGWGPSNSLQHQTSDTQREIMPTNVTRDGGGLHMAIDGVQFDVPLLSMFEQQNALCAIAVLRGLDFPLEKLSIAASTLQSVPGRFERIACGQPFSVIVDYAYEPASIAALLASVKHLGAKRIIGVHGSAGGGRDVARRTEIGKLAGREEDIVVVTNEDPYDDNPADIILAVADGARSVGKKDGVDLFTFADRQEAIDFAVAHAGQGDVVLVTGKGSETVMVVAGGKKIAWDDRVSVRNALAKQGFGL